MQNTLYTIGYHSFGPSSMLEALRKRNIGALVDIRAWPASRLYPGFNAENFGPFLRKNGIYHLCMSENLGVRPSDPAFYTASKVDYEKIAASAGFERDLERLARGLQKFSICLMCKEADPAFCHRAILVAWQFNLRHPNAPILHILDQDANITQAQLDAQLMKQKEGSSGWLLAEDFERERTRAYRKRGAQIAWRGKAA